MGIKVVMEEIREILVEAMEAIKIEIGAGDILYAYILEDLLII